MNQVIPKYAAYIVTNEKCTFSFESFFSNMPKIPETKAVKMACY